jgi:hypothetical protein
MVPVVLLAASYFHEAASNCAKPLWRLPVCGPVVVVNPQTRAFIASEVPPAMKLPDRLPLANYSFDWGGRRWAMVLWPTIPRDPEQRTALFLHELWHRIQADLGLPMTGPANSHLDTLEGRYWMKLEWRALAAALNGDASAVADALAFRAKRRALFPKAGEDERQLEMHEGLANYTGFTLSGAAKRLTIERLASAESEPTLVRSFAYASGPAYGLLLDATGRKWREPLSAKDDLAALLNIEPARELRVARYGGEQLRAQEEKREAIRQERIARFRKALVDSPVVEFPNDNMRMSFNPGELTPIEGLGTVYPGLRVEAAWGTLEVTSGALISSDFRKLTVALADRDKGWKLVLAPGYEMIAGTRHDDLRVIRKN